MLTWVSLVHVGAWLPAELSRHLQSELGISLAEQDLLKQLGAAGGELKLVELARRIFLSKAGITKMVDRLEAAGLVTRARSKEDRRVINARRTSAGQRTLAASRKLLLAWVRSNLADRLTAKQLKDLQRTLKALLDSHGRWEGQLAHLKGRGYE